MTAAEHLALIDAAIVALVQGGASQYSSGSRSVTKHDLGELYSIRKDLEWQVQRESGSGGITLGRMTRPSV